MTLERDIEDEIVRYVEEELGGRALKLKIDGDRGFPDRTLLLPDAVVLFIETKKPKTGRLSPNQRRWKKTLSGLGFTVRTCTTLAGAKRAITNAGA